MYFLSQLFTRTLAGKRYLFVFDYTAITKQNQPWKKSISDFCDWNVDLGGSKISKRCPEHNFVERQQIPFLYVSSRQEHLSKQKWGRTSEEEMEF